MSFLDFIYLVLLIVWFHAAGWLIKVFFIVALANGAAKKIKQLGGEMKKWSSADTSL